ncbi:hypothetical protein ES703_45808 [subsurface metagenome]
MTDIELLLMLIAVIFGAITSAGLGWAESGAAFNARKFVPSLVRAAIAAVLVLVGTRYIEIETATLLIYVLVFFAGMGIDAGGNRLSGTLRTKE